MSTPQEFPLSPLAEIFPPWTTEQLDRLTEDIAAHGLREPILVWRETIIDGRHRLKACRKAGVEPIYQFLDDDEDPLAVVIGENVLRRHLDETQRALVAFRLTAAAAAASTGGEDNDGAGENFPHRLSQREAAKLMGVSDRSVKHAAKVLSPNSQAVPELRQALEASSIRVSDASRIVNHSGDVRRQAVAMVLDGRARTVAGAASSIRGQPAHAEGEVAPERILPDATGEGAVLHASTVGNLHHLVPGGSVDAIISFPPADSASSPLLGDLAAFAVHSLRPTGVMLLLTGTQDLPAVLMQLSRDDLRWVCAFHYTHPGAPSNSRSGDRVPLTQKLLLVYGNPDFRLDAGHDAVTVPAPLEGGRGNVHGPRLDAGMELIIGRFTMPHHVVADPILAGRYDTAVAAVRLGRSFIGAWHDRASIERIRARLAREAGGY